MQGVPFEIEGKMVILIKDDENILRVHYLEENMWEADIYSVEVDPSTICQCTGLKDKNGELIWENDISRTIYNGIEHIYQVIWDESELDFKATNGEKNYKSNFEYLPCCDEVEIIGNVFDNPELKDCETCHE